jgi:prevent-host-death family protein
MVKIVNIHEAKTHLSRLLMEVENGVEVTIARAGRPIARLVPAEPPRRRELGLERGQIWISEDFDEPMPEEWLDEWYGEREG